MRIDSPNVNGDLTVSGNIINDALQNALDGYGSASFTPSGSDGQIQYNNGGSLGGTAQLYYDDSSDRLGIAISSPSAKLHVVSDNEGPSTLWLDRYTTAPDIISRRAAGTVSFPSAVSSGDVLLEIGSRGYHSGAAFSTSNSAAIEFVADDNFTTGALGAYMAFTTISAGDNSEVEKMRLTSDGYLAIGTTTPSAKLHVSGSADGEISAIVSNAFSYEAIYAAASISAEGDAAAIKMVAYGSGYNGDDLAGISRSSLVAITANDSCDGMMFNMPGEDSWMYFVHDGAIKMTIGRDGIEMESSQINGGLYVYDGDDEDSATVQLSSDYSSFEISAYGSNSNGNIGGISLDGATSIASYDGPLLIYTEDSDSEYAYSIYFVSDDTVRMTIDEGGDVIIGGNIVNDALSSALDGYASAANYLSTSFTSQTSINVSHSFGAYPTVQVLDNTGALLTPLSVIHNTLNDFTVSLTSSTTGTIIARA